MAPSSATKVKELQLPVSRVKTIMKSSPDVENVGQDALHLVTKSTELFVQYLTRMAYKTSPDGSKIEYKQIAEFVQNKTSMRFLREILPKKITVRQYKDMMKSQGIESHTSDSSSDSDSSDGDDEDDDDDDEDEDDDKDDDDEEDSDDSDDSQHNENDDGTKEEEGEKETEDKKSPNPRS